MADLKTALEADIASWDKKIFPNQAKDIVANPESKFPNFPYKTNVFPV